MKDDLPQLLTINETAKRLALSHDATRRLISRGDLAVVNVAPKGAKRRSLRIEATELKTFILSRTSKPKRRISASLQARREAAGIA
jgi:excisionase family DNA binding protein